ncbi:Zn-dependent membrane protease [Parafrankia colletiae]|uniref:Zn-dependent membrane protease n=1 Tax=Parafrankia colletiae TaxID=573497 RepID=A0A1S1R0Q5_9ACTN|nr:Zn-dependent membrane protease [Parafrankia colletiae]MCK9898754.1 Zn-dependent membrane protease [Frankia sp. Cpl3]OHV39517.1 Zn-dependent membrane protease [Parafrankia colletiae]
MLFHLAEPAALLGIVLAFVIGIVAHDAAQILAARLARDPVPRRSGRLTASLGTQRISPFSWVGVLLGGAGWAEPIQMNDVWRKRRFHVAAALLAGPLAYALLALGALAGARALTRRVLIDTGDRAAEIVGSTFGIELLLWMAITFASLCILSLVPVPPADGGRILFLLGPQSDGWRRANHRLTDSNIGLAILLAVIILPVLFPGFPSVLGQLVFPLLRGLGSLIGIDLP